MHRARLSESCLYELSKSRSLFSVQICSKFAYNSARVSKYFIACWFKSYTLVFASVFILYVLPRLLFFPSSLSRRRHKSSDVTLRYQHCIFGFLTHTTFSPFNSFTRVGCRISCKGTGSTFFPFPSSSVTRVRHRPPARLVPGRRLAPILLQVYFMHSKQRQGKKYSQKTETEPKGSSTTVHQRQKIQETINQQLTTPSISHVDQFCLTLGRVNCQGAITRPTTNQINDLRPNPMPSYQHQEEQRRSVARVSAVIPHSLYHTPRSTILRGAPPCDNVLMTTQHVYGNHQIELSAPDGLPHTALWETALMYSGHVLTRYSCRTVSATSCTFPPLLCPGVISSRGSLCSKKNRSSPQGYFAAMFQEVAVVLMLNVSQRSKKGLMKLHGRLPLSGHVHDLVAASIAVREVDVVAASQEVHWVSGSGPGRKRTHTQQCPKQQQ